MNNKYHVIYENWDICVDAWGDTSYGEKGCACFGTYESAKKFAKDIALEGGISAIYNNGECLECYCDEKYSDELDEIALSYGALKED